jgi:peptide/nickel transport system permease protein
MRRDSLLFIARRLPLALLTVLGVVVAVFLVINIAPGDPATSALGYTADQEARERFAEENHLDDPVLVRLPRYLNQVAHGDLGQSLIQPDSVGTLIKDRLPVTAQLAGAALVLAVIFSLLLGLLAAYNRGRWPDRVVGFVSAAGLAAPDFWIGLLGIQIFAIGFGILPSGGWVSFGDDPVEWARSLVMPATVLAIPLTAAMTRVLRASLIDELDKDYVRTARGAGMSGTRIMVRYVLKNALLAPLTVLGLRLGYLLGGAIIVESIFAIPGLGSLLLDGINQGDIAVVQGVAIVAATLFVVINLLVDMVYGMLNPRVGAS